MMVTLYQRVWALHHRGWPASRINKTLGIDNAAGIITSLWLLDEKATPGALAKLIEEDTLELKNGKSSESGGID